MKMNKLVLTTAVAALVSSGAAFAATNDGPLGINGASSQGQVDVTLTVPDLVRISGFTPITMTDNGASYSGTDAVCVYRNFTGNYTVAADGTQTAGAFSLEDAGNTSAILYTVDFGGTALTAGAAAVAQTGASTTSQSCGGGTNLVITVDATYEEVSGATVAGAHTDELVITIAPN